MEPKQNIINIAFICDQNYVICTGVAIYSIIRNKSDHSKYRIYVLANLIDKSDCKLFLSMQKHDADISIIQMSNYDRYRDMIVSGVHVSPTALYKFDLPLIFRNLDKLLYLDGDIIVQEDLSDLYNQDISDCYAAVVKDKKGETYPSDYKKRLNIEHIAYFNSGVMLLNLNKIRQCNISSKLLDYRKTGINNYMDQDAFNVVFEEKVKYIPLKYNLIFTCLIDTPLIDICSSYNLPKVNLSELLKSATILHFASSWKPWIYSDILYSDVWMNYFQLSQFSDKSLKRTSVATTGVHLKKIYSKDNSSIEELKVIRSSIFLIHRVFLCSQEHGIRYTVQRIIERVFGETKRLFP